MIVPFGSVEPVASKLTAVPGATTVAGEIVNAAAGASTVTCWVEVVLTPRSSVVVSATV